MWQPLWGLIDVLRRLALLVEGFREAILWWQTGLDSSGLAIREWMDEWVNARQSMHSRDCPVQP